MGKCNIFHNFSLKYVFGHKGQKSAHLVNISNFFGISTYFYIENDGQNIQFFILKDLSKTLYFVRFQIRLNHMTVLFILHVTKEKISKKYFRQVPYTGCQIAKKNYVHI